MNFQQHLNQPVYIKIYPNGTRRVFSIIHVIIKYVGKDIVVYTDLDHEQEWNIDKRKVEYIGEQHP